MIAYVEPQKLTNKSDPGKYRYSDYGTGFDARSQFLSIGEWNKNVVIFAVNKTSSRHTDNRKICMLCLVIWPTVGLDYTPITLNIRLQPKVFRML